MFALYSDYPSSRPTEVKICLCSMLFEKNKDKQKDAGVGLLKIKNKVRTVYLTTQVLDTTNLP